MSSVLSNRARASAHSVPTPWWRDRLLWIALAPAAWLRFWNLDYSHFQGDEIKALYPAGADFPGFLFAQSKGPFQYVLTGLIRLATGGYEEWITRVPFAVASLAVVALAYRLVVEHWGQIAAVATAALMGTCGLLIAFGRIVQYQSWCMFFAVLALYALLRARHSSSPMPLYVGVGAYGLGLLTHWDLIVFAPVVLVTLGALVSQHGESAYLKSRVVIACLAAAFAVVAYYIPYALNPAFAETASNLVERVWSGRGLDTFRDTGRLLSLYLPPLFLPIASAFLMLGVIAIINVHRSVASLALVTWFGTTFAFYMFQGGDPRTHIYTYVVPGLILSGVGVQFAVTLVTRLPVMRRIAIGALTVLWVGSTWAAHVMMVDHSVEHPWYRKRLLGYELPNLVDRDVEGVFGFPYYRGLEQVGNLFRTGALRGAYATNERAPMAAYYIGSTIVDTALFYVHVHHPLSLDVDLPPDVATGFRLLRSIHVKGRRTIDILVRVRSTQ